MSSTKFSDRLIDAYPYERTKPMQVLVLGMPRTGTASITAALKVLGYTPHHMFEVGKFRAEEMTLWCGAMKAKHFNERKPYSSSDIDKLLDKFDAVTDAPGIAFWEEMVEAFPHAKIILSTRDPDQWLESLNNSVIKLESWKGWGIFTFFQPSMKPRRTYLKLAWNSWLGNSTYNVYPDLKTPRTQAAFKQLFINHYIAVRKTIPKERMLEYRVQDGWKPLCDWLGKDVPDMEFPRVNDAGMMVKIMEGVWKYSLIDAVMKSTLGLGVIAATVLWYTGKLKRFSF